MKPIQPTVVTLPDHSFISAFFSGDVKLNSVLFLQDVLVIPLFKFNLLSVSSLTLASSLIIHFFHNHFLIQDQHSKMMIDKGKRVQDLYVFFMNNFKYVFDNSDICINNVYVQTWHNRLGHLSSKCIDLLQEQLQCKRISHQSPCSICPLAKQRKLPFISHNHHLIWFTMISGDHIS